MSATSTSITLPTSLLWAIGALNRRPPAGRGPSFHLRLEMGNRSSHTLRGVSYEYWEVSDSSCNCTFVGRILDGLLRGRIFGMAHTFSFGVPMDYRRLTSCLSCTDPAALGEDWRASTYRYRLDRHGGLYDLVAAWVASCQSCTRDYCFQCTARLGGESFPDAFRAPANYLWDSRLPTLTRKSPQSCGHCLLGHEPSESISTQPSLQSASENSAQPPAQLLYRQTHADKELPEERIHRAYFVEAHLVDQFLEDHRVIGKEIHAPLPIVHSD